MLAGAINPAVPHAPEISISFSFYSKSFANPKSNIFRRKFWSNKIFCGLISKWIIYIYIDSRYFFHQPSRLGATFFFRNIEFEWGHMPLILVY